MDTDYLKSLLHYQPETGVWTWIAPKSARVKAGSLAGAINSNGYRQIGIDGRLHRSSRLAFLYMAGTLPKVVDHINRVRDDDHWDNLRASTPTENSHNLSTYRTNTSGAPGVSRCERTQKWSAHIADRGWRKHLGRYPTIEAATAAYNTAKAARDHYHTKELHT